MAASRTEEASEALGESEELREAKGYYLLFYRSDNKYKTGLRVFLNDSCGILI